MSLPPLPPRPPGPGRRPWVLAALAVLVLVVAAVAGTAALRGGDDEQVAGEDPGTTGTTSAGPSEPSDEPSAPTEEPSEPTDLPVLDGSFAWDLGPVCDREATLGGGEAWSGDPADLRVLWLLEWPDLEGYNEYDLLGAPGEAWNVETSPGSWGGPNAVLCTRVVPGTTEVRQRCEGTLVGGEPGTWDVYTMDLRFELVEATTGELIAQGEPFPAADTLPVVGCAFPPIHAVPGEVLPTVGLLADALVPRAGAFVTGL